MGIPLFAFTEMCFKNVLSSLIWKYFFIKNASRDSLPACEDFRRHRIFLTTRLCHIIPGMTSMHPPQYPETPKDLPGFYFPFEVVSIRLKDSFAEFHVSFPIHGNREEQPCLEMSRILGHSPLAICCSASGWTLQEKSCFYQEVYKQEGDLTS